MDHLTAIWRKSTYSGGNGGNCVEVANIPRTIAIRDSKNPEGSTLTVSSEDWRAFTDSVKARRYNLA